MEKVESTLFQMIGLLIDQNEETEEETTQVCEEKTTSLTPEQKQKFYVTARAPVLKLQEDLDKIYLELSSICDNECPEYISKLKMLKEIKSKLKEARKNAANDIYERINSHGNMGIVSGNDETVNVDLHGLHINEAKEKLNEIIFPFLSTLKKVSLITGHGIHNKTGESVLKNAIKLFLNEKNLRCHEDIKNKGVLHLYDS